MLHPYYSEPLVGLDGQSTDETTSDEVSLAPMTQIQGALIWSPGVSAGVLVFEIAPISGFTGAWVPLFSVDFVADSQSADSCYFFSTYPGPFIGFGRWRITTAISGGTVTTYLQALAA